MMQPLIVSGLVIMLSAPTAAQQPRKNINDASYGALQTWVKAVRSHTPGQTDVSVITVAGLSYETREDLNTGMSLFLAALMGWPVDTDNNRTAEAIVAMGRAAGRDFLKQAAVLHSDVAAYADLVPMRSISTRKRPTPRPQELQVERGRLPSKEVLPPLLRDERLLLSKDGEVIGQTVSSWNWPFARSLIDLLSAGRVRKIFSDGRPDRATDPFVSAWYHATTAFMFARGLYGEATPHLHHASMVLPDDALAVFDRACYAEILGLPMLQTLVPRPGAEQHARASGAPTWSTPASSDPPLLMPSIEKTNGEAEQLFRRALQIDPLLVEARVRLARLLQVRGRHEEAAAELKTALGANPTGVVAFYAHLFAGRTLQALGQTSEAAQHYASASALFPDAQSAILGSSQVALFQADVPATLAPLERLGSRSSTLTADPWWYYDLAAGRDVNDLLRAMWAEVPPITIR
jgi:hypothetical protein